MTLPRTSLFRSLLSIRTRYFGGRLVLSVMSLLMVSSCASTKDVQYLQDIASQQVMETYAEINPTIQIGDVLAITVNSRDPELAVPFNLPVVSYADQRTGRLSQSLQLQGYLVQRDGTINFPIIGKLSAVGLTKQQLMDKVSKAIIAGNYLEDPIVTINFLNFKVSVLGEVSRPGTFQVENERMTILQALATAGDMTIYGRRDNVIVLREVDGKRVPTTIDLRSAAIFESPVYFLKQNDVVIVAPNKTKAQMSGINSNNSAGVWISVVSAATSVATLMITILK